MKIRMLCLLLSLCLALFPSICFSKDNNDMAKISYSKTERYDNVDPNLVIRNVATILAEDGFTINNINSEIGIITATKKIQKKEALPVGSVIYNTSGLLMGIALSIFTFGICTPVAVHYGVKLTRGSLNTFNTEAIGTVTQNQNDVTVTLNLTEKAEKQDKALLTLPVNNSTVYQEFYKKLGDSLK